MTHLSPVNAELLPCPFCGGPVAKTSTAHGCCDGCGVGISWVICSIPGHFARLYNTRHGVRAQSTPNRSMDEALYQSCLSELTEGHLALDRLGAPREVHDGDFIRECLIAERIALALTSPESDVTDEMLAISGLNKDWNKLYVLLGELYEWCRGCNDFRVDSNLARRVQNALSPARPAIPSPESKS